MNRLSVVLLVVFLALLPTLTGRYGLVPDDNPSVLMQPVWAAIFCAMVLGISIALCLRRNSGSLSMAQCIFGALVGWAALSVLARIAEQRSPAFLGQMTHAWAFFAAQFVLFSLARSFAKGSRTAFYVLIAAAVCGAAIVAADGANEYVTHLRLHEPAWRVFGMSTPDFLAAYLAMLIPMTLALFLAIPGGSLLPLLLGLITLIELAAMLTTGSRFALVSAVSGIAIASLALWKARSCGLTLEKPTRTRILAMAVLFTVAAIGAAGPILHRLLATGTGDNSAAFRLWTWRGALRMALANPVFGTGIGAWSDTYPRYALTGFTRLAHSGYLQIADECGLVAFVLLLCLLGVIIRTGWRGLGLPLPILNKPSLPAALAAADDRLLLCGLLGSLTAGIVQNMIDSDWSVFYIAGTFWTMAGLTVGLAVRGQSEAPFLKITPIMRTAMGSFAVIVLAYFASQAVASGFIKAAREAPDLPSAETNYLLAGTWDMLGALPRASLGYGIYAREGNLQAAEALLREAASRQPNATNLRRLGTVLAAEGKQADALRVYQQGLHADPHSLDILMALASTAPPPQNFDYYQRIAALEDSPVGTVRAIGGVTEPRFAVADAALGDMSFQSDPAHALAYYTRAAKGLTAYAAEGGSENIQRQAMTGGHDDPAQDIQLRALAEHVAKQIALLKP